MDLLKKQVSEYVELKETLKKLTDRKNQLERAICDTMADEEMGALDIGNGKLLNYKIKESLSLTKKEKTRKGKEEPDD